MNYKLIIDDLKKWNQDEFVYREYHFAKAGLPNNIHLIDIPSIDLEASNIATHPDIMEIDMRESRFFMNERNVSIIKHPRYLPLFMHQHSFFEMLYVLSGSCIQVLEDTEQTLTEGDICILAPNVLHGLKVYDNSIVLNILVKYSTFSNIFQSSIRDKSQLSLFFSGNLFSKNKINYLLYHTLHDETIRNYILDMYLEQIRLDEYSDRIICSIMTIFFTQLTRRHGKTVEFPDTDDTNTKVNNDIINYILTNYSTVSLQSLSNQFGHSVSYCSKIIKSITGISFSELLRNMRLQKSEHLLTYTQLSISDISHQIGYKNPETYIRCFQRNYSMTPGQFRVSHLNN